MSESAADCAFAFETILLSGIVPRATLYRKYIRVTSKSTKRAKNVTVMSDTIPGKANESNENDGDRATKKTAQNL